MPDFFYMARDKQGALQSGRLEGVDEDEVVAVLQNRGLFVTRLSRKESLDVAARTIQRSRNRRLHGRVTTDDQVLLCQQLATLIEAGIPLLKSLEVVSAQLESRPLLNAIEQMHQDIEGGRTFRDAMARHPRIFSSFWVNLVATGEASGHLAKALNLLARYLESARMLQRKAATAMIYPAILVVMAIGALVFFLVFFIPKFSVILEAMKIPLPLLTRWVMGLSQLVRRHAVLVLLGMIGAGWGVARFAKTEQGKSFADRLALRLPLFSRLFAALNLAQFSRGLGTLLESGVPVLYSLEIMELSATNRLYGQAIGEVKEAVREGKPMAEPMGRSELFPPMVVQMVQVGEEIGELGKMLSRIATYFEERADTFIERMTEFFVPVAIVVMAAIIGTILVSMYMPIFSLGRGFGA